MHTSPSRFLVDSFELDEPTVLPQVYSRLVKFVEKMNPDDVPPKLYYDDGCGLRKFSELRKYWTATARRVWERIGQFIFVDKLHYKGHSKDEGNEYCFNNCNPNSEEAQSEGIDTERAEQTFSWLKRFKNTARYMQPGNFNFFLLIICDEYNKHCCNLAKPGVRKQY